MNMNLQENMMSISKRPTKVWQTYKKVPYSEESEGVLTVHFSKCQEFFQGESESLEMLDTSKIE